jgi:hypothetical protein
MLRLVKNKEMRIENIKQKNAEKFKPLAARLTSNKLPNLFSE